jgi:two-component system sensor histidine kinase UhpB
MANLRPTILDEYGLVPALHWYSQESAKRTGLEISFTADELPSRPVTEIETALFRIAQEATNNSVKHARAKRISMVLNYAENRLHLAIEDDGAGFEMQVVQGQDDRGWGLMIMQERCVGIKGLFRVESMPGQGTRISVEVPL